MKLSGRNERILIYFISAVFTVLTTITLFSRYWQKPPSHRFVGVIHYWEDYFYYLDQFFQGKEGALLSVNRFNTQPQEPSLLYLNHLLLGRIGGMLGLEPFDMYNISVVLLKFLMILLSYRILVMLFPGSIRYRLTAFAIFLTSTSFPTFIDPGDGSTVIMPYRLFRGANLIFSRFGNTPDSLMRNVVFMLILIIVGTGLKTIIDYGNGTIKLSPTKRFVLGFTGTTVLLAFLSVSDTTKTMILTSGIFFGLLKGKKKETSYGSYIKKLGPVTTAALFPSLIAALALYLMIRKDTLYMQGNAWDIESHRKQLEIILTNPLNFFISFGTLSILSLLGVVPFIRKGLSSFERVCFSIATICLAGYFLPLHGILPIPGFRYLFTSTYIFYSAMAVYGIIYIRKRLSWIPYTVILSAVLIPNLITFSQSFMKNAAPVYEPDYHFVYLPDDLYQGMLSLREAEPKHGIAVASPNTSMDILIPGLTGKYTYSGHLLMTPEPEKRDANALKLFYEWTNPEIASGFMRENGISFLFWTSYDGDAEQIKRDYPFLTVYYENPMVTIFRMDMTDNAEI